MGEEGIERDGGGGDRERWREEGIDRDGGRRG